MIERVSVDASHMTEDDRILSFGVVIGMELDHVLDGILDAIRGKAREVAFTGEPTDALLGAFVAARQMAERSPSLALFWCPIGIQIGRVFLAVPARSWSPWAALEDGGELAVEAGWR